uniref:Uncharacterized protein n=1 Tax=Anguilla anguilla TaxID=7936 RepID=A0A0E9R610_ANGAN
MHGEYLISSSIQWCISFSREIHVLQKGSSGL